MTCVSVTGKGHLMLNMFWYEETSSIKSICILQTSGKYMIYLQFQSKMIDTLYNFAKFQYECGNYSGAAEYLYFVRVLVRIILQSS